MDTSNIIWLVLLFSSLVLPALRRFLVARARAAVIKRLEQRNGSKVITLIHRQESVNLLGIPVWRYIDIEESERVLREIRNAPAGKPLDLVLHTPGGLVLAAEQIAMALARHGSPVRVYVPHYAMSGGTLLALAAGEIYLDPNAVLGPVDPQLGQTPAASLLELKEAKKPAEMSDETFILVDVAQKAMDQVQSFTSSLLRRHLPEEQAEKVASALSEGRWTHDYPLTLEQLLEMGLPVGTAIPAEVYELMDLYAQQPERRPSLLYTPAPGPERRAPKS